MPSWEWVGWEWELSRWVGSGLVVGGAGGWGGWGEGGAGGLGEGGVGGVGGAGWVRVGRVGWVRAGWVGRGEGGVRVGRVGWVRAGWVGGAGEGGAGGLGEGGAGGVGGVKAGRGGLGGSCRVRIISRKESAGVVGVIDGGFRRESFEDGFHIFHRQHPHCAAGVFSGAGLMRGENDIIHMLERVGNMRLIFKNIQSGPGDNFIRQRRNQRLLVNERPSSDINEVSLSLILPQRPQNLGVDDSARLRRRGRGGAKNIALSRKRDGIFGPPMRRIRLGGGGVIGYFHPKPQRSPDDSPADSPHPKHPESPPGQPVGQRKTPSA